MNKSCKKITVPQYEIDLNENEREALTDAFEEEIYLPEDPLIIAKCNLLCLDFFMDEEAECGETYTSDELKELPETEEIPTNEFALSIYNKIKELPNNAVLKIGLGL